MLTNQSALTLNPLFLRHDLMIEMGRLEMALDYARAHEAAHLDGELGDRLGHGEGVAAIAVLVIPLMGDGAGG